VFDTKILNIKILNTKILLTLNFFDFFNTIKHKNFVLKQIRDKKNQKFSVKKISP